MPRRPCRLFNQAAGAAGRESGGSPGQVAPMAQGPRHPAAVPQGAGTGQDPSRRTPCPTRAWQTPSIPCATAKGTGGTARRCHPKCSRNTFPERHPSPAGWKALDPMGWKALGLTCPSFTPKNQPKTRLHSPSLAHHGLRHLHIFLVVLPPPPPPVPFQSFYFSPPSLQMPRQGVNGFFGRKCLNYKKKKNLSCRQPEQLEGQI